ncbi:MAG: amidase family protein, partial [Pseudomonadota bacterium]
MSALEPFADATAIADAVHTGAATASAVVKAALDRVEGQNSAINAFSLVLNERARAKAAAVDDAVKAGSAGPLAGVPFAVKNLFDLEGIVTRAGAKLTQNDPPAARDADLVVSMEAAGAICIGAL